jgi:DNA-binding CsgD family transcriptional regulator/PAS domain-containing protein
VIDRTLLRLIELTYESSLDPSCWPDFLSALAESAGSTHAAIKLFDFEDLANSVPAQFGFSPEFLKGFEEYWGAADIYFLHGRGKLHTGWIEQSQEFLSDEVLSASPYYNEFAVRENIFHQCGAVVAHQETRNVVLTILRSKDAGQFGSPQLCLLQELLPHIQRASEIHFRLAAATRQRSQMETVIDHLAVAIVFTKEDGQVIFANRSAQELFRKRQSLWIEKGFLTCYGAQLRRHLQAAIARAARTLKAGDGYPGEILKIERPGTGRPLAVTVTPLPPRQSFLPEGTTAAIFISDPDRNGSTPDDLLRILFGLTPAESRLAATLFNGYSLEEAGEALGVTRNTLASQLKSIFSKTGARRQSDLMRLMGVLHAQRISF